jgi:hypothetical protein
MLKSTKPLLFANTVAMSLRFLLATGGVGWFHFISVLILRTVLYLNIFFEYVLKTHGTSCPCVNLATMLPRMNVGGRMCMPVLLLSVLIIFLIAACCVAFCVHFRTSEVNDYLFLNKC